MGSNQGRSGAAHGRNAIRASNASGGPIAYAAANPKERTAAMTIAAQTTPDTAKHGGQQRRPWYRILYVQVLIAIVLGIVLGRFYPQTAAAMKPLGDGFINLVKMM